MSTSDQAGGLAKLPGIKGPARRAWLVLLPASRLPPWAGKARWAVAVVLVWLGLAAAATLLSLALGLKGPPCLFRWLTTVPCPTCGTGRGATHLLSGDPLGALLHNPLFFGVLVLGGALLLVRLLLAHRVALGSGWPLGTRGLWLVFAALFLGNWVYLVVRGI